VLAIGTFVILAGNRLLGFFGPEFQQGRHALVILVIGWAAAAIVAPVDLLGGMTGHQRSTSMVMIAALGVNAALNLLLIPRWGIEGAAWASVITLITWRGLLAVYLGRRLGINPSILPITVRARAGGVT
jgi:O-antigen/teichoic acid export membrane protein